MSTKYGKIIREEVPTSDPPEAIRIRGRGWSAYIPNTVIAGIVSFLVSFFTAPNRNAEMQAEVSERFKLELRVKDLERDVVSLRDENRELRNLLTIKRYSP